VGPPWSSARTRDALRDYPFDAGLYDGFEAVGLAPGQEPATLGEVNLDAIAGRILREQYLSGISRTRLFVPSASTWCVTVGPRGWSRARAMSLALGRSQLVAYGGYAWGSGDPLAEVAWRPVGPGTRARP
jgi:hypothetical protein